MKRLSDNWHWTFGLLLALTIPFAGTGCKSGPLKDIPIFNPSASLRNRAASAEELLIEVNSTLASLRDDGILTQDAIDKAFKPRLDHAKQIIFTTRAVAKGSTTQPTGTLDEARQILIDVRDILNQMKGGA